MPGLLALGQGGKSGDMGLAHNCLWEKHMQPFTARFGGLGMGARAPLPSALLFLLPLVEMPGFVGTQPPRVVHSPSPFPAVVPEVCGTTSRAGTPGPDATACRLLAACHIQPGL